MSQTLAKQGWLHRVFNTRYPYAIRAIFAVAGFLIGIVVSLDWRASKHVFLGVLNGKDVKSEARRLSWMGKRGWLCLPMPEDPMFDFCQGLDFEHLQVLQTRLQKKSRRPAHSFSIKLDHLRVLANIAQSAAERGFAGNLRKTCEEQFQAAYEALSQDMKSAELFQKPPQSKGPHPAEQNKRHRGMNPQAALSAFRALRALFAQHDLPWFMIAGTFLGAYREGGFIKNDLDLDIGVMAEDVPLSKLLDILGESRVFHISRVEHQLDLCAKEQPVKRPALVRIIHEDGINVDIFFHFQRARQLCHGTSSLLWENTPFKPAPYSVYGLEVHGPDNPDIYLTETYGDWQTPATDYNYHRDMPSLTGAPNYLGIEYLLRRKIYHGA